LTTTRIKQLVAAYNDPNRMFRVMLDRKERLKHLVDKHGLEAVALAGGYTESTLKQYLRNKLPNNIGLEALNQAETVLRQLEDE